MKVFCWLLSSALVAGGCKPNEKASPAEAYTPIAYTNSGSNKVVVRPNTAEAASNNIYTRGNQNKTAGQEGSSLTPTGK